MAEKQIEGGGRRVSYKTIEIIFMRDHGGLDQSWFDSHRDGEQWLYSRYISMVNSIENPDRLDVGVKEKYYANILVCELPLPNKIE